VGMASDTQRLLTQAVRHDCLEQCECALSAQASSPGGRLLQHFRIYTRLGAIIGGGTILMLMSIPLLPLLSVSPRLWRAWGDGIQRCWTGWSFLCCPRMQLMVDTNVSAEEELLRPTLTVMNHQIDTDWFIAMAFLEQFCPGRLKIILKSQLKYVPVLGAGAMLFGYVFVQRRWEEDKTVMNSQIRALHAHMAEPMWLLVYPEGTTIHVEAVQKSHEFAAASKPPRPKLGNLLLPRVTGVTFALRTLREVAGDARIVDVTVAYDGYSGEVPTYEQGYTRAKDLKVPSFVGLFGAPFFSKDPLRVHVSAREVSVTEEALLPPVTAAVAAIAVAVELWRRQRK
jgi:1-acyl-sn-glycerol-3-phosphate acyltransferase